MRRAGWQFSRLNTRNTRHFTVLAMESSADDTAVAIVDGARRSILSNVVIKQHAQHEEFGGIHPHVAIQWHQRNLPFALQQALREARMHPQDVDGIAFTRGPGMNGCLSVSINAAKNLAAALKKPIVGVHHMQAHALTPELTNHAEFRGYPFLTLLISGGHTMVVLATSVRHFKILASTVDIAIGNAFDKAARLLRIPPDPKRGYGAALESFCRQEFPVLQNPPPMTGRNSYQPLAYNLPNPKQMDLFSFTGLTAAVQRLTESQELDDTQRWTIARAFQRAAFAQLELRLKGAIQWCKANAIVPVSLVVSGGVASNGFLRQRLGRFLEQEGGGIDSVIFPPVEYCTDNAAMIAWASMHRFIEEDYDDYGVLPLSTWNIEDLANVIELTIGSTIIALQDHEGSLMIELVFMAKSQIERGRRRPRLGK